MTNKNKKIQYAEQVIDYANRRTIGEMIDEPGLYEAIRTTNKYLKRYIANLEKEIEKRTACKGCGYLMLPEEDKGKMDDGSVMCEECTIKAEANAKADWDTKEDALKS